MDAIATPSGPASVAGAFDGDGEEVGEAEPGDDEAEERCPQGGSERAEEHADRGRGAAVDQGAGPAQAFEQPGAGEPADGHGEREAGVADRRRAGCGVEVLFQVQGAPVGQGSLAVGRAQGDQAEGDDETAGTGVQAAGCGFVRR